MGKFCYNVFALLLLTLVFSHLQLTLTIGLEFQGVG
ncbi:hypothetical protein PCC7424_3102 [Gloeothece citriformis PCC 7424]|uniref:Uncharacterized protein n=1 Tax=Gloeothece citriformis (strain PCC 7424) TaxID=65393 RepID=B7KBE8_GLOC7|nr:hypothetical protein PCC7424_3102 [Gloeothece citriformis PCC 7424]